MDEADSLAVKINLLTLVNKQKQLWDTVEKKKSSFALIGSTNN